MSDPIPWYYFHAAVLTLQGEKFPFGPNEVAGVADRFTDDQPRYFSGVVPALFRHLLTAGEVFGKMVV